MQKTGVFSVVNTDDLHFPWYFDSELVQPNHDLSRRTVIRTNKPIGAVFGQKYGDGVARFGIANFHHFRKASVADGLPIASDSLVDRSRGVRPAEEDNALAAALN